MNKSELANQMETILAASHLLYVKTQNFHWNVTGPNFQSLHEVFQSQYEDLSAAIDEAAEIIRELNYPVAPMSSLINDNTIINDTPETTSASEMLTILVDDQTKIADALSAAMKVAQDASDEVVADFLIGRQAIHRKNRWMLNSMMA